MKMFLHPYNTHTSPLHSIKPHSSPSYNSNQCELTTKSFHGKNRKINRLAYKENNCVVSYESIERDSKKRRRVCSDKIMEMECNIEDFLHCGHSNPEERHEHDNLLTGHHSCDLFYDDWLRNNKKYDIVDEKIENLIRMSRMKAMIEYEKRQQ